MKDKQENRLLIRISRWSKQYIEEQHRTDAWVIDSFEKYKHAILEKELKAVLKVSGRKKPPGVDGISIELIKAT